MLIKACTKEHYINALKEYFSRLHSWELKHKNINSYIQNAYYTDYVYETEKTFPFYILKNINVRIVFTKKNIEYGLPHTLQNIIIIPLNSINLGNINSIIDHELIHIYCRYNTILPNTIPYLFKIKRPFFYGEITNPDTIDFEGMYIGSNIVFIVLMHDTDSYKKIYYSFCEKKKYLRRAFYSEIKTYNKRLPFNQNYHSEEIIAVLKTL